MPIQTTYAHARSYNIAREGRKCVLSKRTATQTDQKTSILNNPDSLKDKLDSANNITDSKKYLDALSDLSASSSKFLNDSSLSSDYTSVNAYVSQYNSLLSSLKDAKTESTAFCYSQIVSMTSDFSSKLSEAGITINDSNELVIDKDKFTAASAETKQSLFYGTSSMSAFFNKVSSSLQSMLSPNTASYGSSGDYVNEALQSNSSLINLLS